jgi:transposase-like protein
MKAKMLEQFKFTDELKERLVLLVVFQNQSPKELAKKYGLPNVHILTNWVRLAILNLMALSLWGQVSQEEKISLRTDYTIPDSSQRH